MNVKFVNMDTLFIRNVDYTRVGTLIVATIYL